MVQTEQHPERSSSQIRMIIFDLDGVLIETSRSAVIKKLMQNVGIAMVKQRNIQEEFFAWMDDVTEGSDNTPYITRDQNGNPLPACMGDWLNGIPKYDSYHMIDYLIDQLDTSSFSRSKYRAYRTLIKAIFDPHERTEHTCLHTAGNHLLEQLQTMYPTCTFAILSNYDTVCFSHIYHKPELQHMFKRFAPEHVFISGYIQTIKPDPAIFHYVCTQCGVSPDECLFIDDQMHNIQTAQEVGMWTHWFGVDNISELFELIRHNTGA